MDRHTRALKVGVFGGSFDPPHFSHVELCSRALELPKIDRILVVPCFRHALSKVLSPFEHRFRMCELAFADLDQVEVSSIESELDGISYTLHTLQHLASRHPEWELSLLVGADALRDRHSWYRFDRIEELATIVAFGRGGVEPSNRALLAAPPEMSSTDIRDAIRAGESPSALVPRRVLRYISMHGLYTNDPC